MSLLVIKNDGIGDLILASGLIGDLARKFGPVDLITCAANAEIANQIEGVDRVMAVSRDDIRYDPRLERIGIRWMRMTPEDRRIVRHLRENEYEVAICLRRYIRQSSLILMHSTRARRRFCAWLYPTNLSRTRAEVLSRGWSHFKGDETGTELNYYRSFVESTLRLYSASPPMLLCTKGILPSPEPGRIGFSISGASAKWPASQWLELARMLTGEGRTIVLFGGTDAQTTAGAIAGVAPGVVNLVGGHGFEEAIPELRRLELLIGNDTGMTHYATLCTARVMCIMGGGTFGRFFPWPEDERQYVLFHALDCYDCDWSCLFPEPKCLGNITPLDVKRYMDDILRGQAIRVRNLARSPVSYVPGWRRTDARRTQVSRIETTEPMR
jgi:ADP-heptose:LPS heptosyltransferase